MDKITEIPETGTEHVFFPDSSVILRCDEIPWTPWALPGTRFKLLDFDINRSYSVILLEISPEAPAEQHKHIGAANAFILKGGFSYEHGTVREGQFFIEAGGIDHTPHIHPDGCILLGWNYGVLVGLNEDGSPAGIIDVTWQIEQVKANGAFEHLRHIERN